MSDLTVRLPGMLAELMEGESRVAVKGETLREALEDLVRRRPLLTVHIFDDARQVRRHILCFHGQDQITRWDEDLDIPVHAGDTVTILHSVSGG